MRLGRLRALGLIAIAAASATGAAATEQQAGRLPGTCAAPRASAAYTARVRRALRARTDVWGGDLLAAPGGPTYERARRYLAPLLYARSSKLRSLTASGVYYLPFSQPLGPQGAGSVALHVADGGQIAVDRADGRTLTIGVGTGGRERYGSCLRRLGTARLADGWLPILQTRYVDEAGVRYRQESFSARVAGTESLTSFVRLTADAGRARGATRLRVTPSTISTAVPRGGARTIYVAWRNRPPARAVPTDAQTYDAARRGLIDYWRGRLSDGAAIQVPERRVQDAMRSLLVQNLAHAYRYSIGNPYEEFSFPESIDNAQVIAEYGFGPVSRTILRASLGRRPTPYPNWKMGEKLLASARYFRLFGDRAYLTQVTPVLRGYVNALGRQITASRGGLLGRERYSSDIAESVYGLHSQAVVWQGLRELAPIWAQTGSPALAATCRRLAARLGGGLRRAVAASQRRLPDGSLFIPVSLLDDERPYGSLTEARLGSYWNLVMPYALASGFFAPHGPQANGVLRYMQLHGSRLLGLVRGGSYALYRDTTPESSGTDQVYGLNVARFLADNDRPDQLLLSLYGQLAAGMTENTFVAGEGATVTPLRGALFRAMYLPPNSTSNAAFLETLRVMLVHETRDAAGLPRGLELAYATPRAWLRPGQRIAVQAVPTSFGPVSFSIESAERTAHVSVDVPERGSPRPLSIRLRSPAGRRIAGVTLDGRPFTRFNRSGETIDLTGYSGTLTIDVRYA